MNLIGVRARPGGGGLRWEAPRFRPFSLADFYSISVLRPGGVVVLTVPFDPNAYSEEFVEGAAFGRAAVDGPQFYQRRYDEVAVWKRLSTPALVLERTDYFGEPRMSFEPSWNRIPMMWKLPALWAQPLLAKLFLRRLGRDPRGGSLGVALTYRKLERSAA